MTTSVSFLVWIIFFAVILAASFLASRRSRPIMDKVEDVAASALPEIGRIAEDQHQRRFGRPPTDIPGERKRTSWYPATKATKKRVRPA